MSVYWPLHCYTDLCSDVVVTEICCKNYGDVYCVIVMILCTSKRVLLILVQRAVLIVGLNDSALIMKMGKCDDLAIVVASINIKPCFLPVLKHNTGTIMNVFI